MASGPPSVSVIIPAHNAADTIAEQLAALVAQRCDFDFEIVVVLNRCTDDTLRIVTEWSERHHIIRHIVADEVASASFARNAGASAAEGEILAYCDADDVVRPGWLAGVAAALEHADVVGGRLDPHPATDRHILDIFPVYRRQQRDSLPTYRSLRYAMTASMAIRREPLLEFGGFDDTVVHGTDDVVVCLRAQQVGLRLGFAPEAQCWYRVRADLEQIAAQRSSYTRANIAFDAQHYPAGLRPTALEWAVWLALAIKSVVSPSRTDRARLSVHRRVQHARVRARRELDRTGRASKSGTGLLVSLAGQWPSLERLPGVGERIQRKRRALPPVECTVALEQPIIAGLGFLAPHADAEAVTRRNRDPALEWLDANAQPGDLMIDLDPGVGTWAVAAAIRSGRSVHVITTPTDPRRSALRINLARHVQATNWHLCTLDNLTARTLAGPAPPSRTVVRVGTHISREELSSVLSTLSHLGHSGLVLVDSPQDADIDWISLQPWQCVAIGKPGIGPERSG